MRHFDVILVGGGVMALATAAIALRRGLSVAIVAPEVPIASATLASGAMLGVFGEAGVPELEDAGHLADLDMRWRANALYDEFLDGIDSTPHRIGLGSGTLIVGNASHETDHAQMRAIEKLARLKGARVETREAEDVPELKWGRFYRPDTILHFSDERYLNPNKLVGELQRFIADGGGHPDRSRRISDEVTGLSRDGSKVTGVLTANNGELHAACVVLCNGFGIRKLLSAYPDISGSLPEIFGGKGTALILRPPEIALWQHVLRTPNRDFACGSHIVPGHGDCIYAGATNRLLRHWQQEPFPALGELHVLTHSLAHEFSTDLRLAEVRKMVLGVRPYCADGHPLVGKSNCDGLYFGTGTYRNGVLLAPLLATLICDEIEANAISPENIYSAHSEMRKPAVFGGREVQSAIKKLVSFLQEPHHPLPYGRAEELEKFISLMLRALTGDPAAIARTSKVLETLSGFYMEEDIVELFYALQSDGE